MRKEEVRFWLLAIAVILVLVIFQHCVRGLP